MTTAQTTKTVSTNNEAAPAVASKRVTKTFAEKVAATAAATSDRKRFSFGPVWNAAVIAGTVTDHDKLVAQAVKLKVAARSDAKRLKFETLRGKVAAALTAAQAAQAVEGTTTAE